MILIDPFQVWKEMGIPVTQWLRDVLLQTLR